MSRDLLNWNIVMEKNVDECFNILHNYDWEQLQLSDEVNNFILNISLNHHCNKKVLLCSILSGIGHFAETTKVHSKKKGTLPNLQKKVPEMPKSIQMRPKSQKKG